MEDIDKVFRTALRYFCDQRDSERQFALELDVVSVDYMNKLLSGKRKGEESIRRQIADKLGYPGRKYEDFLDIGRNILIGEDPQESNELTVRGLNQEDLDEYNFLQVKFRDDMRLFAGGGGAVEGTYDASGSPVVVHRSVLGLRAPNAKKLVAFRVGGDSMEPTLGKDGIVIVDTTQNDINRIHDRDIYAYMRLSDGECGVKRLSQPEKGGKIIVESDNVSAKTFLRDPDDIQLIGRVIWSWREH